MRIRIVDAFTDRPFAGNPAGVLLLGADAFPDDTWLQRVAAEVNLSETAFAHPLPRRAPRRLGAALVHPGHRGRPVRPRHARHRPRAAHHRRSTRGTVRFATRSGVLVADARRRTARSRWTSRPPRSPAAEPPQGLAEALGAEPLHGPTTPGRHIGDLLVELADEKTVRGPRPRPRAPSRPTPSAASSPPPRAEDPARGYDFVSRCFFPAVGIDEDPVTGSAHTALAPFWSARLGRADLTGLQASARSGLVRTELRGDRMLLTGTAVTVIDGELLA